MPPSLKRGKLKAPLFRKEGNESALAEKGEIEYQSLRQLYMVRCHLPFLKGGVLFNFDGMQRRHNKKYLVERRKELRKNLTPAEAYLWTHLKARKLEGRRFQRQHSINNYIVDFYCASEKLIVELDGEVHRNPIVEEKDAHRDAYFENLGFTVLRFENKRVFENLDSVLQEIKTHIPSY